METHLEMELQPFLKHLVIVNLFAETSGWIGLRFIIPGRRLSTDDFGLIDKELLDGDKFPLLLVAAVVSHNAHLTHL